MSIPTARPQVPDFFGIPPVTEPPPARSPATPGYSTSAQFSHGEGFEEFGLVGICCARPRGSGGSYGFSARGLSAE
jgi:hypothetical protein